MYPINMKSADGTGFAVANDEAEHQTLADAGYGPAYVAPVKTAKAGKNAPADTAAPAGE